MMLCTRTPFLSRATKARSIRTPVLQYRSGTPDLRIKDTSPSNCRPYLPRKIDGKKGEGYLAFTKSSLYKLVIPLFPSSDLKTYDHPQVKNMDETQGTQLKSGDGTRGRELKGKVDTSVSQDDKQQEFHESPQSIVFLLHSGQPLSYIACLIRSEATEPMDNSEDLKHVQRRATSSPPSVIDLPINFHISSYSNKRWSLTTGFGAFLREAARVGEFTIKIGSRRIRVVVPNFEERTHFLRAALKRKTERIQSLTQVKDECDDLARRASQKVAFAGAGIMTSWWVTVGVLTFHTSLGWDTMEPITYLTGLGMAIGGYIWFLWHNREVSYRAILTETTTRRQQRLYSERGFDPEVFRELIEEAKELRRAIKQVAWDYELDWDQSKTTSGQMFGRALEIIRDDEEQDRKRASIKEKENNVFGQLDDDGDGQPNKK